MIEGAGRGAVSPRIKVAHEHDYVVNNCDVDGFIHQLESSHQNGYVEELSQQLALKRRFDI